MGWVFTIIKIISAIFIVVFLAGMISAAILGRRKNRRAYAIGIVSQLPEEITKNLIDLLLAYKNNQTGEVNNIVANIGTVQLDQLFGLIGPQNRPKEFSAGKFGDNLTWAAMEGALQDRGYTINASKIVTGITHHYLDDILLEINQKFRQ